MKHLIFILFIIFCFPFTLKCCVDLDSIQSFQNTYKLSAVPYQKPYSSSIIKSSVSSQLLLDKVKPSFNNSSFNKVKSSLQNDSFTGTQSAFDFINGAWIGTNFMLNEYRDKMNFRYDVNTINLDAGIGWYNIKNRGNFWNPDWSIYGGGLGLEFAFPISNSINELNDTLLYKFRYLMINLRAELTKGFRTARSRFNFHLTAGLSSDIVSNYARIGIGNGYQNFQIGIEYFANLNPNSVYTVNRYNFYMRYILGKNRAI